MHGLVVLDENDEVIRPAILWNDGRTQKETDYLNNEIGKEKLSRAIPETLHLQDLLHRRYCGLRQMSHENFAKINKDHASKGLYSISV